MTRQRLIFFQILLILSACVEPGNDYDVIIHDVNIIDLEKEIVLEHRYVGITGERITIISSTALKGSGSAVVIDGSDKYLIPGLWDMHTHYYWNAETSNPLLIANGVLGVREMFGDPVAINYLRDDTESELIAGPEIVSSGRIVDGAKPFWPNSVAAPDAKTAREIVQRQHANGADFIKVYSWLSREAYFAIADECEQLDIPFAGHVPYDVTFWEAIESNQASAEHLLGLLESSSAEEEHYMKVAQKKEVDSTLISETNFILYLLNTFDAGKFDSLCAKLANSNTWLCPTMVVNRAMANLLDSTLGNDPRMAYMPGSITHGWDPKNDSRFKDTDEAEYAARRQLYEFQLTLLGKMQQAGVRFLAGTDFPNPYCYPGFSLHDELAIMVEGGFTPAQALQTATINPSIYLNKHDDYGNIAEGKFASLVILDRNPLEDITNTQSIRSVLSKGVYFDREDLDDILENVKSYLKLTPISELMLPLIKEKGIEEALKQFYYIRDYTIKKYSFDEWDINVLGYELMKQNLLNEAVEILKINAEMFPTSSNVYDSLAESYWRVGKMDLALKYYQKSLELNSNNTNAAMMIEKITGK